MGNTIGPSGYSSSTTAEDITKDVTLDSKVILITGSNTGIGLETARVLANTGAHIIMACRDTKKMENAIKSLQDKNSKVKIDGYELDLGNSKSIDSFVEKFKSLNLPLHILINNAGVMAVPQRKETADKFEYQNGINHLGHFRLTNLLLPIMIKTEGEKRIVNLSSSAHRFGPKKLDFDNFHFQKEKTYSDWGSYGQSKLCNILFSNYLERRLKTEKIDNFIVTSLHPGYFTFT